MLKKERKKQYQKLKVD